MGPWTICMIAFLAIMLLTANGIEDKYTPENYICDPAYAEYESCESTNVMKKNYLKSYPIDYNYEETIARYYNDLTIDEEKRNRPRPGCDCHVKIEYVFTGASSYPPFYKNVTCQEQYPLPGERKCIKGFHCSPITYPVKILQRKHLTMDTNEVEMAMPAEFQKCWKEKQVLAVAGCVCSPQ